MAIQQGRDVAVWMKAQTTQGTEETAGSGATKFLYKDGSPGFSPPQAALIESTVNLGDGLTERGRRGSYNIPGTFNFEAACGNHSIFYPIYFRNDWAAALTLDESTGAFSSATLSVANTSEITLSGGSWITAGLRVGDAVKFTSGLDSGDLNKWFRIKSLTATVLTTYETLTNVTGPVAAYDLTVPKKLLQGTTEKILTMEQYYQQADRSLVVHDVKGNSLNFTLGENTTLDVSASVLGAGYAYKATGSSPHFTGSAPTGDSLAFLDACFAINGSEVLSVTGFNIGLELNASALAVANGCGTTPGKSPNIFQGNGKPTGQWSMALEDFTLLEAAAGETQIDFIARFLDPNGTDILQLSVLNAIMTNEQISPLGQDGAMIQTFDLEIGRDKRGGAYDATSIKMFDSQAA